MTDIYLFRAAMRDLTRAKRLLVAAVLVAVPALIVGFLRIKVPPEGFQPVAIYDTVAPAMVFGFILVILAVVFGTGVVSQEVEQKTIVYLLTRPVPRWRILAMKFLAAFVAITVTSWIALLLLGFAALYPGHMAESPLKKDLLIIPVGALAYGACFLLLATLVNKPLLWGLLYAFGIEAWAPNFPGIQKISLMAYLRVIAPHTALEKDSVEIRDMLSVLSPSAISTTTAWWVLGSVIVIASLAAMVIFSRNEYVPREDAE